MSTFAFKISIINNVENDVKTNLKIKWGQI